jgi:4-cresol dehydrogenase (hydroxylating)
MTEGSATILPPGYSADGFEVVIEAFVSAVGSDAVVSSPEELAAYRDPYAFGDPDEFAPSLVVMPASVEEVQAVLRVANEHRVPLWTAARRLGCAAPCSSTSSG